MATTTPNYGWDVPTSTDYVKDGATAIETLGDDIDATLWTALGGAYPGLRLVKKQTVGTAVSSVTVTSAFSATYVNYKIVMIGGSGSALTTLGLKLGAANTNYYSIVNYANYPSPTVPASAGDNNQSQWNYAGYASSGFSQMSFDLLAPFLSGSHTILANACWTAATVAGSANGVHQTLASYTDFTITPATGTLTGGTIYVYGYGAS